ncbi:MAG: hypothetical protein R3174_11495, partial [Gammaproteobacteria bacterium]|nr:hypothetical protein [Gammaproteobacteria bacterium]
VLIWDQALVEGPETFDVAVRYFTVLAFLELFSLTEIPILAKKPDENKAAGSNKADPGSKKLP